MNWSFVTAAPFIRRKNGQRIATIQHINSMASAASRKPNSGGSGVSLSTSNRIRGLRISMAPAHQSGNEDGAMFKTNSAAVRRTPANSLIPYPLYVFLTAPFLGCRNSLTAIIVQFSDDSRRLPKLLLSLNLQSTTDRRRSRNVTAIRIVRLRVS
jgi:hypothetical protein